MHGVTHNDRRENDDNSDDDEHAPV
jgi:hypothetical protein